jgi:imidazolonepropionase-like amidohydrolase
MLTMTGGHGSQIRRLVDGVDSATRQTRECIAQGADFIKVMATGGVVTRGVSPEQTALQPEELAAITRAAHDAGKLVTAHVTGAQGARNAITAGIDTLEHAMHIDADIAALAAEHNVSVVPTLCATAAMSAHLGELPGWMAEKIPPVRQLHHTSFRHVVEAGLLVGTGTDGGTPFNQHGSIADELECMVELGIDPAAALRAATIASARIVGREHEIGSLAAGKSADLALIAGDPAASIPALRQIRAVYYAGKLVHSTK